MTEIPSFAEYFRQTTKVGFKERLAKRFNHLPPIRRIAIMEQVKNLKVRPNPETYLK